MFRDRGIHTRCRVDLVHIIAVLRHDVADRAAARHDLLRITPKRNCHRYRTAHFDFGAAPVLASKHLVGVLLTEFYAEFGKNILGFRLYRHIGEGLPVNMHADAVHVLRKAVHRESTREQHHAAEHGTEHRVFLSLNEIPY